MYAGKVRIIGTSVAVTPRGFPPRSTSKRYEACDVKRGRNSRAFVPPHLAKQARSAESHTQTFLLCASSSLRDHCPTSDSYKNVAISGGNWNSQLSARLDSVGISDRP